MSRAVRDKGVIGTNAGVKKTSINTSHIKIDYDRHIKDFKELKKRVYFVNSDYDYEAVIADAMVLLSEDGDVYNPDVFYQVMWKAMGRQNYAKIKETDFLWSAYLRSKKEYKARKRKLVGDYYIRHLLSKKHSMEYINAHPELVSEKTKEILNIRRNGNSPIDNGIPIVTDELIDLSMVNPDYKGYAITAQGELYSCKSQYRTDVLYTEKWYMLAKRKNGAIRLNVKGKKKDLSVNRLMEEIYKLEIYSI